MVHVQVRLGNDKVQFWNFVAANDGMPGLMTAEPRPTSDHAEYQSSKTVQFLKMVSSKLKSEATSLKLKAEVVETLTTDLIKCKSDTSQLHTGVICIMHLVNRKMPVNCRPPSRLTSICPMAVLSLRVP